MLQILLSWGGGQGMGAQFNLSVIAEIDENLTATEHAEHSLRRKALMGMLAVGVMLQRTTRRSWAAPWSLWCRSRTIG